MGLATVHGPFGSRRLGPDDLVWVVKAVAHEVPRGACWRAEAEAVLWTMLNRWASGRYGGGTWGEWVQRFSQPINPNQIGVIHSYDVTDTDPTGEVRSGERDARIAANRARPLSWYVENRPEVVGLVRDFFYGRVPARPEHVALLDFAAGFVSGGAGDVRVRVPGVDCSGSNAFYRESWASDWTARTVRVEADRGWIGPMVALFLGFSAGGAILWWAGRRI